VGTSTPVGAAVGTLGKRTDVKTPDGSGLAPAAYTTAMVSDTDLSSVWTNDANEAAALEGNPSIIIFVGCSASFARLICLFRNASEGGFEVSAAGIGVAGATCSTNKRLLSA
jgi:hypothetical protein